MKTMLIALLSSFILTNIAIADDVIQVGSNAHNNVLEVRDFLLAAGQDRHAAMIDSLLINKKLYSMDKVDIWGDEVEEDGFAYFASKKVLVREDHLHHNTKLSLTGGKGDFRKLMNLMFILIHEGFHITDFGNSPYSPELNTYERSFIVYHAILWNYLLPKYEEMDNLGANTTSMWRDRVSTYANALHTEMATYDTEKHGVMKRKFAPVLPHNNCVTWMKHEAFSDYALNLGSFMGRNNSFKKNYEIFDRWAKYSHPIPNNARCIKYAQINSPLLLSTPVGYRGPRLRQMMYVIDRIPEKSHLKIKKLTQTTADADITFDVLLHTGDPSAIPRQLDYKKSLYSWQLEKKIYFNSFAANVIVVVYENREGKFPKSVDFQMTRVFKDENGNEVEGPLAFKQLNYEKQRLYGFHNINRDVQNAKFDQKNPHHFERSTDLTETFKVNLLKGDFIRMKVPKFDSRSVHIYKLKPSSSTTQTNKLERVHVHYSWVETSNFTAKESGTYYITTLRGMIFEENKGYQVSLDFSRNGAVGPEKIKVEKPTLEELALVGMHPSLNKTTKFSIDSKTSSLGHITHLTPNFKGFTAIDLNTRNKDYIKFLTLPTTHEKVTAYLVEETEKTKYDIKKIYYSFHPSGEYKVNSNNKHYLFVSQDSSFQSRKSYQFKVKHVRQDRQGPSKIQYRILKPSELTRFGFHKRHHKKYTGHTLEKAHPTGFTNADSHFRHYRVEIKKKTKLRIMRSSEAHHRVGFSVSKLDWDLYLAGKKALTELQRAYYWHRELSITLEKGFYYITIEGPVEKDDNGNFVDTNSSWHMFASTIGESPETIEIKTLDISNSKDHRLRLID